MLTMDQIHRIRQLYYEQGLTNLSEIARQTGLDWKTVSKYVDMTDFNEPDPMPKENNLCPKLDPFKPLIDNWLTEDKKAPRKQRHTAKRVYRRLRKEAEGFNCSYRLVADYVKAKKLDYRKMKSRWGSCQPSTGRICINIVLALYPPECLEYVVVHELCHLLVPGHGPQFRELMDRVMPDWRTRKAKLS